MVFKVQLYDLDFPSYPVQMNLNIYVQFICNQICWIEIIAELLVTSARTYKVFWSFPEFAIPVYSSERVRHQFKSKF